MLLPPMTAPLDTLCVLGNGLNKKWLSTDDFWNEAAFDSFFQANDFVKGADGLWHLRVEADQPAVNSVWSQVTDSREVELRPLQKREWRVVISQKWKFGDVILLCEARALFRGLQVMVCAEHVRNARVLLFHRQHVLCPCL